MTLIHAHVNDDCPVFQVLRFPCLPPRGLGPFYRQCHALLCASLLARIAVATAKLFSHPSPKRRSNSYILQRAKHCQQWDVPLIHTRVQDDCSVSDVFRLPCLLPTRSGTFYNECPAHLFASVLLLSASVPISFCKSSALVFVAFRNTATVVFITLRDWIQRHSHCEPYRAIPMEATSVTHVRQVPSVFEMASKQDSSDSIFLLWCRPVFHPASAAACLTDLLRGICTAAQQQSLENSSRPPLQPETLQQTPKLWERGRRKFCQL